MSAFVGRLWIIYEITRALEIRSGLCGYERVKTSRGPLVSLTCTRISIASVMTYVVRNLIHLIS